MKTKNLRACILLFVLFFASLFTTAFAQQEKKIELQSTPVAQTKGKNPNIKADFSPLDKPIAKARGGCNYQFENYTGLFIKVYVDGYYKGTMDAWGKATLSVTSGYTKVYLISVGGTREWSSSGDCDHSPFIFTLR